MDLDDEVCLCFHVTKRKLQNFLRIEKPRRAGQMSECFGAGTGCGWCRSYLERMFQAAAAGGITVEDDPAPAEYARARAGYIRGGGGTPPPGATPIDETA
ncbi:MAG: (2Fe-2S)-binding protein [Singulisphaera sp.]